MTTDPEKLFTSALENALVENVKDDGLAGQRRDIRPTLSSVPLPGALQSFLQTNQRLHDQQRKNIQLAKSKYEMDRLKLIDGYRIKLEDLQHEADRELKAFDAKHEGEIADSEKLLGLLADVQKAGTK